MSSYKFTSSSEQETGRLGEMIAGIAQPGDVLSLVGTLGAGKTRLVQGIAVGLGNTAESITSPTFVLVNEYRVGRLPVFHFDAYRLKDDDEFLELGPEEYFDGDGITLVEWGDRVAHLMPGRVSTVSIDLADRDERRIEITGPVAQRLVGH